MRAIACALAFSIIGTFSASAEVLVSTHDNIPDDGTLKVTLPAGDLDITMNTVEGYGLFVHAGGSHEVLIDSAHMPRLLKTHGDSALLELNTGTSACPILFAWVTYDAEGLRTSGDFGTCAEEASFAEDEAGPVVSMNDVADASQVVHYAYDEASAALTETKP